MPERPLLALVGPTASGKTECSITLAESLGAEIVSIDSTTMYRGMDVGTAKPTTHQRARVPHHLVDIADPDETFTVARYQSLARDAIEGIVARGRRVLLVGGSGLYFRAIVDELSFPPTDPVVRAELEHEAALVGAERMHRRLESFDPAAASRIEPQNVRRTVRALEVATVTGRRFSDFYGGWREYRAGSVRAAGIDVPRLVLAERIERRVREHVALGLLEEVRGLRASGFQRSLTSVQAIGYAEMSRYLDGGLSPEDAVGLMVRRTKALARRQLAWFRRDPRVRWFTTDERGATGVDDDVLEYLRA